MELKMEKLKLVFNAFRCEGEFAIGTAYGSGHINDTYLIITRGESNNNYILQRINHKVFKEVPLLQQNISRVTTHLKQKIETMGQQPGMTKSLWLYPARDGNLFHTDKEGNYWRLYPFIEDTCSYDLAPNADIALQGGIAYGSFLNLLSDLPGKPLPQTIPGFHSLTNRWQQFSDSLNINYSDRSTIATTQINFVTQRYETLCRLEQLADSGKLRKITTHNDTKINNVLFDRHSGQAACVIDLDTVMAGIPHFDFGDAIRTLTNTAAEDTPDLETVAINKEYFAAFAQGYLSQTARLLAEHEVAELVEGARYMCYLIGLRFLTDYLAGDTYFKTKHPEHNLQRAKVQFRLVADLEKDRNWFGDTILQSYSKAINQ